MTGRMEGNRKILEDEIKQLLEDSKAENDALKKLIAALQEEELKMKKNKGNSGESSPKNNI
jgi:hypothetical protein